VGPITGPQGSYPRPGRRPVRRNSLRVYATDGEGQPSRAERNIGWFELITLRWRLACQPMVCPDWSLIPQALQPLCVIVHGRAERRQTIFVDRPGGPRRLNTSTELACQPEPPIGIEPMTYALRGCSRALLAASKPALASCSQVAAGGGRWLLIAVRGHLGDTLQYSVGAVAWSGDQPVHLPDHGLLGRQIEPGGSLPMRLPLLTHHLSK
jgi:hypothetical protein